MRASTPHNQATDTLSKRFESAYAKLSKEENSEAKSSTKKQRRKPKAAVAQPDITPTCEDRRKLALFLSQARTDDLTFTVQYIDRYCPTSLTLNGDAIDINVDTLDAHTFSGVERKVCPAAHTKRMSRTSVHRSRSKRQSPNAADEATGEGSTESKASKRLRVGSDSR